MVEVRRGLVTSIYRMCLGKELSERQAGGDEWMRLAPDEDVRRETARDIKVLEEVSSSI